MKQIMNNNLLRKMNLFVLIGNKETLQPAPWCYAGPSQGPTRVLIYSDQLTHFQMKLRKDRNISSQAL